MHRGINILVRDESEDEDELEENIEAEAFLNIGKSRGRKDF